MRKGIADGRSAMIPLSAKALRQLDERGFKFVQVRGLTSDWHYEYIEPYLLLLMPVKELPRDQGEKDIYEPISSPLLLQWALERNEDPMIFIGNKC